VLTLLTAAVGFSASKVSATPQGALTIAMIAAFSGPDAVDGQANAAGCYPAVLVINKDGGVLGHKLQCTVVDTRGDPADAIPAVQKLLATTSSVVGVLGPSSTEATAVLPLLQTARIPAVASTGQAFYDHTTDPYFWRNYPADDVGGVALAVWAHQLGLDHGALFFDNSVSSQGSVPALLRTYSKLGGRVAVNLAVTPDSTSYGSEISRLISSHPDVIFTESDPQTDATAFANLMQLGHLMPILGTNATVTPQWLKALTKAIGPSNVAKYYEGVEPYAPPNAAASTFEKALLASGKDVPNPSQWVGQEYASAPYDGTIIMALAMVRAKSVDPAVYNNYILKVTAPSPGKTIVHTYAAGLAALKAGKAIQYVGADGATIFNKWHNSTGSFEIVRQEPNGQQKMVGTVSAAQLAAAAA
jgi:ABC-type branched-subunit amino acid transport system substrate-binding protein